MCILTLKTQLRRWGILMESLFVQASIIFRRMDPPLGIGHVVIENTVGVDTFKPCMISL